MHGGDEQARASARSNQSLMAMSQRWRERTPLFTTPTSDEYDSPQANRYEVCSYQHCAYRMWWRTFRSSPSNTLAECCLARCAASSPTRTAGNSSGLRVMSDLQPLELRVRELRRDQLATCFA